MNKILLFILISICFFGQSFAQENWHDVSRPDVSAKLLKIYFFGDTYIINTDSAYYLISTNNGINWEKITENNGYHSYEFASQSVIFSVMNNHPSGSVLYKSTNTGITFDSINFVGYGYKWSNINFINMNTGFINRNYTLGGPTGEIKHNFLLKTINSGLSWDTSNIFMYFSVMIGGGGAKETYFSSFRNLNDTLGYATYVVASTYIGNTTYQSNLWRTTNLGSTWDSVTSLRQIRFYDVSIVSPYYGYVTSDQGLLRFKDSTYYLDTISTLKGYSYFKNKKEGFLYSKSGSFSLFNVKYTSDSGRTWSNLPINHHVSQIKFKDANTGFMITESGKIYRTTNGGSVGIFSQTSEIADNYILNQNYPNPFNPSTKITFQIPKSNHIQLKIYDALGKEIALLVTEHLNAGTYEVDWNASNFPSGVYYYKLSSGNFSETKKMILLK